MFVKSDRLVGDTSIPTIARRLPYKFDDTVTDVTDAWVQSSPSAPKRYGKGAAGGPQVAFRWFLGVMFCAALFLLPGILKAQGPATGSVSGSVFDPSGAIVPGARVSILNDATQYSRSLTTSPEGTFRAALLPPGTYLITVEASNFTRQMLQSIRIVVGETSVVAVTLQIGSSSTQIEVKGSTELAQTESSTLGRAIDGQTMVALPLANRNFTQLLALSPGAIVEIPNAGNLGTNSQNVSVNGAKTTANNFQFNGIDANNIAENSFSGEAFAPETGIAIPNPDTIAEFKVQTGMYDASYGRSAGGNVDFVSKSGTNRFHGSLWEFFRNDALNANDFFVKENGQPRPELKQNQFGGALEGPIRKDRTFFFVSYQGTTQRNGDAASSLVSTFLPALTNDRSAAALGLLYGGKSGVNGGVAVAPNGSNINPVALALLNFKLSNGSFAIPNPQRILPSGLGESTFSIPANYREDQFTSNLDESLSSKNQLSGRFFYSRAPTDIPFNVFAAHVPGFGSQQTAGNDMFVLSDTHAFNPNVINVARFGFVRFNGSQQSVDPIAGAAVGMATPPSLPGIPGIVVSGLFTIGPPFQLSYFENTNSFVWQDTVSLTRGKHTLRVGIEAKRYQLDVAPSPPSGSIAFLSFPDFLLGETAAQNGSSQSNILSSSGGSGLYRKDERYTDYAGFIQDDVRLTSNLTVNAGLRYEYFGPPNEIHGRLSNFDPSIASAQVPASGSLSGFVLPANYSGPLPNGVIQTQNSGMWNADHRDFSPRVGFALRLMDRPTIVLRGGYGIYYERLSGQLAAQNLGQTPFSVTQRLVGVQNAAASLQEPFNPPLPLSSAFPIFIPRTPTSAISVAAISQSVTSPYTQQYNLNLQYEVAPDLLLQAGYVGSKTTHLTGCLQFNQALLATPQHPVNGLTTTTNDNLSQRLPFAGVAGGSYICETSFDANYNGLQASVTKRLSHGLDLQGSYTYSKNLDFTSGTGGSSALDLDFLGNDQTDPRQSRGLNDFDRTHRIVLSFVFQPPALQMGPSLVRGALSHWQFSGVSVLQSGLPVTVTDSTAASVFGNLVGFSRAQCTGANPASAGSLMSRLNGYFNSDAFAPPPAIGDGTGFGNCGVGILKGPHEMNFDFGIQKNISVAEWGTFQFRTEFFNLTNTPAFGLPNNDYAGGNSLAFGVISSTVSNPRIIQFALKYVF
jgi:Carboxypeptidase regulatory-like domain/TonB-dependent Receptor Plug Domain/TonB dependent receptor